MLKKQHREALLLDSFMNMDGLGGRSLRHRKAVTYTFDDYDRSINEAIKITKRKQPSPEPGVWREVYGRSERSANGIVHEPLLGSQDVSFSPPSPPNYDEMGDDHISQEPLERSRRRQRPQRYSEKEFVEAVSDNDGDFDSDDDIVGEAVYDEEYLRKKRRKKLSSGSEGDEEYHWSEENGEEEEEDSFSMSEDSDGPPKMKRETDRTRRETKFRSVVALQPGLRRSRRSTRNRINYQQYDMSESDPESSKRDKANAFENEEFTIESPDFGACGVDNKERGFNQPSVEENYEVVVDEKNQPDEGPSSVVPDNPDQDVGEAGERGFLDLNEVAPGSGFDDGSSALIKDEEDKGSF